MQGRDAVNTQQSQRGLLRDRGKPVERRATTSAEAAACGSREVKVGALQIRSVNIKREIEIGILTAAGSARVEDIEDVESRVGPARRC